MSEQTPIPAEAIPGEPPTYGRHKPKVIDADCGHDLCYAPCPGPVDVTVCASDEEDWPCEVVRAYAAGLAAGRTAVAADIREALAEDLADTDDSSGEAIWEQGGYRKGLDVAARIAENGADQ